VPAGSPWHGLTCCVAQTSRQLQYNYFVMQDACINPAEWTRHQVRGVAIVLGVATACLSTSLGSMFGSARILQAIARDGLVSHARKRQSS
jgi:amino acid transporter